MTAQVCFFFFLFAPRSLFSHMRTHMHTFKAIHCPLPSLPPLEKTIHLMKLNFWKAESKGFLMNHNHWPEWIRVLRDDIFPGGFLTHPSFLAHAACPCTLPPPKGGVCQLKLPHFPGALTEVYIMAGATAVEPRCRRDTCRRQPDGAPPAEMTRGLHLDRVGKESRDKWQYAACNDE